MFLTPRLNPIIVVALLAGLVLAFALGAGWVIKGLAVVCLVLYALVVVSGELWP